MSCLVKLYNFLKKNPESSETNKMNSFVNELKNIFIILLFKSFKLTLQNFDFNTIASLLLCNTLSGCCECKSLLNGGNADEINTFLLLKVLNLLCKKLTLLNLL